MRTYTSREDHFQGADRKISVKTCKLRDISQSSGDISENTDRAAPRLDDPEDEFQKRCLSTSIGAYEQKKIPLEDIQGNIFENRDVFISERYIGNFNVSHKS